MKTQISQDLLDYLVKSNISIGRYSNKVAGDIIALLNLAEADIIKQIEKRMDVKNFTGKRLEALLGEIRAMNSEAYAGMHESLKQEMLPFAVHSGEVAALTLTSQVPLKWDVLRVSDDQLRAIVSDIPIRIGENKTLLLKEIFEKLAAGKEEAIRGAMRLSMIEGESVSQATRRLMGTRAAQYKDGVLQGSRRDMESIARSVIQSVNNTAVQQTFAANESVLNGWTYIGTLDSRLCGYCSVHYGKTFPLGKGPLPIRHVRCRCFQAPAVKSWKELGFDDMPEYPPAMKSSSTGLVRADLSYSDWLKGQSAKLQDDVLGPVRGKMLRDGKFSPDKFTDVSGKFYTLEQLKGR